MTIPQLENPTNTTLDESEINSQPTQTETNNTPTPKSPLQASSSHKNDSKFLERLELLERLNTRLDSEQSRSILNEPLQLPSFNPIRPSGQTRSRSSSFETTQFTILEDYNPSSNFIYHEHIRDLTAFNKSLKSCHKKGYGPLRTIDISRNIDNIPVEYRDYYSEDEDDFEDDLEDDDYYYYGSDDDSSNYNDENAMPSNWTS
ncbi:hypothetical protein BN7_5222 [Wickerhamomyces ciferrii]|uniref:Uncharacterized protein n=1 Tax=Wickerhamomyces ciferrii (strain ATCC 14091 / BCRC 22168 / CBS 111 / JCM 3599 / NBRC 0793 / NRRL Y-1031 F-60-10) TaxID=1206466 RepID=K0KX13_WICCF|nr:uncharacterized protein BN7_5222 [Wickerhamomyces ciferrii]CCH45638.1 hypothetical protein BN7_5222 [Wickerhamomyces ciferrii]